MRLLVVVGLMSYCQTSVLMFPRRVDDFLAMVRIVVYWVFVVFVASLYRIVAFVLRFSMYCDFHV